MNLEAPSSVLALERPLVVFDLETTGVNPHYDRIVEVSALKLLPDGKRDSLNLRVNPERVIPAAATAIHGITNEDVATAPVFAEAAAEILRFLARSDLAGFGITRFDVPLLCQEFRRVGFEFSLTDVRLVDVQRIYHMREPRTLSAALKFYCGQDHADAHSAEADVRATLNVLEAQFLRYEDLPRNVAELDELCNPRDTDAIDEQGKLKWRGNEAAIAFGQKSGITLREMAANEPGYLRWMLNKDFSAEVKEIVRAALAGKFPQR